MTDLNLTSFVQLLTEAKLDANLKTGGMVLLFGLKIKFKSDILDFIIKSVDNLSDYRYITLMLTNLTKHVQILSTCTSTSTLYCQKSILTT